MKPPPELWFPTPNAYPGHASRDLIVVHSTRSGIERDPLLDWGSTINWFAKAHSQVSSQILVGYNTARFVADDDTAWHAGENNARSLGMEILQPTADTPYIPASLDLAAAWGAVWCLKYGIPPVRVMTQTARGFIGHEDSEQGKEGGKSDPGRLFPWWSFMQRVKVLMMFGNLEPIIKRGDWLKLLGALRYIGVKM